MNLKQAAAQLGVHYQTAYKWVRAGDLTAIRVGGRYEVSPAAITQFVSSRSPTGTARESLPPVLSDRTPEDGLEELEALATEPFLSQHAIATFAAIRGAELLGDLCVVARFDPDGQAEVCAVGHPDPGRTVSVESAMDVVEGRLRSSPGMSYTAYAEQRVVRVPHVPQDQIRRAIRPELRQHLSRYPIHSLLAVPIFTGGSAVGAMVLTRDTPNHPYTDADEAFAVKMCARIGSLMENATAMGLAWTTRQRLVDAVRAAPILRGRPTLRLFDKFQNLIQQQAGSGLPCSILGPDLRFLAVNSAFLAATGYPLDVVRGELFETFVHADSRVFEQANFARLISGELDYLDIESRCLLADGTDVAYASHRAAVRDDDATLRAIVTVARPLHIQKADYAGVVGARANFG